MDNIHNWINTALILAVGLLVLVGGNQSDSTFGNKTASFWDAAEGYRVDGVSVISGTGAGSFTGSLSVGSSTPTGEMVVRDGTATSTLLIDGATQSCLVMRDSGGTLRYFIPNEAVVGGMGTTTAAVCGF